jgi:hypothetical protein
MATTASPVTHSVMASTSALDPAPIVPPAGQAQKSQSLNYYCYTWGLDSHSWTYVKNLATAKQGWIRDDLLSGNGSSQWCGF